MRDRDIATGAEERVAELFVPDTMLPSQYFDRVARRTEYDGERRLMIAVLEDAVDVYRKLAGARDARRQQLFKDAEEWIESPDRSWIFSFLNICEVLGIEPEYLRRGLHDVKHQAQNPRQDPGQVLPIRVGDAEPAQEEDSKDDLKTGTGS